MRIALASLLIATLAGSAAANGRDPYASSIQFRPGLEQQIVAGMTFGLIRSNNGGATWQWYCENAIGYSGTYDPDYAYTSTGAVFATTFDGLKVMRDGCTFAATPPGTIFVTHVERGPDGAIYFTASDRTDGKIYKSTDDGVSFPTSAMPGLLDDWWQTIVVAPSDATRVYLSGYRTPYKCTPAASNAGAACDPNIANQCPGGVCEPRKEFLAFKSLNGGTSYQPMTITDFTPISANSTIDIVGVDPVDADIVYARVTLETATSGESIYKSTNAGTSWTKILTRSSNIGGLSFLVRNDGSCVAGTRDIGAWKAAAAAQGCGTTWTELVGAPHIGCLYKNSADEVWACTQNSGNPLIGITSDGFAIMKSADLMTWTGVLRLQDIEKPVPCDAGTVQEDQCVQKFEDRSSQWCCLITQLGITSLAIDCTGTMACNYQPDPDGQPMVTPPPPGCWDCQASSGPPLLLPLLVAAGLLFRRRRPVIPR